jgi:hypothetical protein
MSLDDIKADMNTYAKKFPVGSIPHLDRDDQIVDPIHNYQHLRQKTMR